MSKLDDTKGRIGSNLSVESNLKSYFALNLLRSVFLSLTFLDNFSTSVKIGHIRSLVKFVISLKLKMLKPLFLCEMVDTYWH